MTRFVAEDPSGRDYLASSFIAIKSGTKCPISAFRLCRRSARPRFAHAVRAGSGGVGSAAAFSSLRVRKMHKIVRDFARRFVLHAIWRPIFNYSALGGDRSTSRPQHVGRNATDDTSVSRKLYQATWRATAGVAEWPCNIKQKTWETAGVFDPVGIKAVTALRRCRGYSLRRRIQTRELRRFADIRVPRV